ncbi:MAG: hypothetical protein K2I20_03365 [Clostridia bacterium]|nr:hypothetical protein [Clostridia bacterium]MDE6356349.1 hypothetical protein [Clostridia bacterium]
MRKVLDYVKDNKKIIIVVALIIILIGAVYLINVGAKGKGNSSSVSAEKSPAETKLTSILSSIEGVGATDVMITETDGKIAGVVIVCEGANNIMVKNDILNAVATALNIDKKIIAIYSMNI